MGHTLDTRGKPLFADTPTQTITDMQAAADFAEKIGGLLKGTSADRESLTAGQLTTGWLFSETDTGAIYQWATSGWSMVARPAMFFRLGRTTAFDFTNVFVKMTWDAPAPGVIQGFETLDNQTFTCKVPGTYMVNAILVDQGSSAVTSIQVRVLKNGVAAYNKLDTTSGVPAIWKSHECGGPVRFEIGDTLAVDRLATSTITGRPGETTSCTVDYLHA